MDEVYKGAKNVIVWLGEITPTIQLAFQNFERIYAVLLVTGKDKQEDAMRYLVSKFAGTSLLTRVIDHRP